MLFSLILGLLNILLVTVEALRDKDTVEKIPYIMNGLAVALILISFYLKSR